MAHPAPAIHDNARLGLPLALLRRGRRPQLQQGRQRQAARADARRQQAAAGNLLHHWGRVMHAWFKCGWRVVYGRLHLSHHVRPAKATAFGATLSPRLTASRRRPRYDHRSHGRVRLRLTVKRSAAITTTGKPPPGYHRYRPFPASICSQLVARLALGRRYHGFAFPGNLRDLKSQKPSGKVHFLLAPSYQKSKKRGLPVTRHESHPKVLRWASARKNQVAAALLARTSG